MFLVARIVLNLVGGVAPRHLVELPAAASVGVLVGSLVAGALGEELGWRGLGQRQLQLRLPALSAAVIIGVLWSAWHLWPLITPGGWTASSPSEIAVTLARLVATSVLYAWVFNSTGGGLVAVMVAHTKPGNRSRSVSVTWAAVTSTPQSPASDRSGGAAGGADGSDGADGRIGSGTGPGGGSGVTKVFVSSGFAILT